MKKLFLLLALVVAALSVKAADRPTYWHQRASLFEQLPIDSTDVVFLGNSITDGCEWGELFCGPQYKNRGISGDTTDGVLERLDAVTSGQPDKIFLMIGINDISRGRSIDSIAAGNREIIRRIHRDSPRTRVYLQSVLPVSDYYGMFQGHTKRWADIAPLNDLLRQVAQQENATFVDIYSHFVNPANGMLDITLSNDGLHMLGPSYLKWRDIILPYVVE